MTVVAKTYTFVPGTPIESDHANQNFNDLVNYINAEGIVRDASKAFTVVPSGPATDPTTDNQFTRKKYVNDQDTVIAGTVTALTTTVGTNTTNITKRPTINNNTANMKIVSASVTATTNANGDATVTFPNAFTSCTSVVAVSGDMTAGAGGTNITTISMTGFTNTTFTFRAFKSTSVSAFGTYILEPSISAGTRINYIAVGT